MVSVSGECLTEKFVNVYSQTIKRQRFLHNIFVFEKCEGSWPFHRGILTAIFGKKPECCSECSTKTTIKKFSQRFKKKTPKKSKLQVDRLEQLLLSGSSTGRWYFICKTNAQEATRGRKRQALAA